MQFNHKARLSNRDYLILAGISLLSVGAYIAYSGIYHSVGFPLDDAWIHQTYARNLAQFGEWSFLPGQPSGGSTAPLWSALLAIGFFIRLAPFAWAFLLGAVVLWALAVVGETLVRDLVNTYDPKIPWVGILIALEWHLVWAAGSGMETLPYSLLVLVILALVISGSKKYFGMGLLIGLAVWFRPDGITLIAAVGLAILLGTADWSKKFTGLLSVVLGAGSLVALYLLFNLLVSGSPLPSTFYAKQTEYAVYQQIPLIQRLGGESLQPLIGVGVILLPGFIITIIKAARRKNWSVLLVAAWLAGYLILYAWRLPVTYQHGRYVIPMMPVFFLLSLAGIMEFDQNRSSRFRRIVPLFWRLVTGVVLAVFWVRGALAYAQDVALIQTEMVTTAKWVAVNIPQNALIATHDIGAMGFYGGHNLLDLAGLVSPEVIPFMRDETRLANYLNERGVSFLVTFPDWYPQLTSSLIPLYSTHAPYAPALGELNMAVYQWPGP
jgi:hypothetical protein